MAEVFERHAVSIRSMEQEGLGEGARIIFITHVARGLYDVEGGGAALAARIDEICAEVSAAIADGARIIVLSDRHSTAELAPIPSLLLTGAVHHHLVREKTRTQVGLIVEAGDVRVNGVAAAKGSAPVRLDDDRILINSGSCQRSRLTVDDICTIDLDANQVAGKDNAPLLIGAFDQGDLSLDRGDFEAALDTFRAIEVWQVKFNTQSLHTDDHGLPV